MQFRPLDFSLKRPQYLCHTQTDRHFKKSSKIVFRTFQNVYIRHKPEVENFHETNTFFYMVLNDDEIVVDETFACLDLHKNQSCLLF